MQVRSVPFDDLGDSAASKGLGFSRVDAVNATSKSSFAQLGLSRRVRFSLGSLLLVTTVLAVVVGTWANGARRQQRAVTAIINAGGLVRYAHDQTPQSEPPGPQWLRQTLGDHFFFKVHEVRLGPVSIRPAYDKLDPSY